MSSSEVNFSKACDAATSGDIELLDEVLSNDARLIDQHDRSGMTLLSHAVSYGHYFVCNKLIELGADVQANDQSGNSPLIEASLRGYVEIASLLITSGANCEHRNKSGESAFTSAIAWGHLSVVRLLIQSGVDVNLQDEQKRSPLMLAISSECSNVIDELIDAGADINQIDSFGTSVVEYAVKIGNYKLVKEISRHSNFYRLNKDKIHSLLEIETVISQKFKEAILNLE